MTRSPTSSAPPPAGEAEAPWQAGLRSARATFAPGLVILAAAGAVVGAYYCHPGTREALEAVAVWRRQVGFAFAPLVTMVLSGLLPFLYLHLHPATARAHPWAHLPFFAAYWAYKGFDTNFFYWLLSQLFGTGHDWTTLVQKTLFENFVYNAGFTIPYGVLLYAWKDAGFRWREPLADLRAGGWYRRRILPVLLSVWAVWLPAGLCIYALPLPLQIVLFNLLNCFWVIFFSHVTARRDALPDAEKAAGHLSYN